jgi:hypothetical protein
LLRTAQCRREADRGGEQQATNTDRYFQVACPSTIVT